MPPHNATPILAAEKKATGPSSWRIVVQCSTAPFAGVTAKWLLEISFVEWNNRSVSVFIPRSNSSRLAELARYATFKGLLTWRRALHYLRRSKALAIGISFRSAVRVVGATE